MKCLVLVYVIQISFILSNSRCDGLCGTLYGEAPCTYIPAPPGKTPPCARPGYTYCEHIEQYPMQHIRYLIDKWGYDYSTLLNNEITENYNTYFTQPNYNNNNNGYASQPNNQYQPQTKTTYPEPEPIYIPKPAVPSILHPDNKYIPVLPNQQNLSAQFNGYPNREQPVKYTGSGSGSGSGYNNLISGYNGFRGHNHNNNHGYFTASHGPAGYNQGSNQVNYFEPSSWWRYTRDNRNVLSQPYSRARRSTSTKKSTKNKRKIYLVDDVVMKNITDLKLEQHHRSKRQGGVNVGQQLCPTRSSFIMPQAALNNKGNWMYVVNLQEDTKYTQLVKSETCISQQCNSICGVPAGYTARCEQRYVQKRLVALEGAGQNLYTDVFWFPSCCVCTVTNN